jgi:uncharacterized membrane protein
MNDPRRTSGYDQVPMGLGGAMSTFVPQGVVGLLGFAFLAVLFTIAAGLVEGAWLFAAVIGLLVLVFLIVLALRREMRRAKEPSRMDAPRLPDDSELSDDDRQEAMRRYKRGRRDA